MEVKNEICSITGHRPNSLDGDYTYNSELWRNLRKAYEELYLGFNIQRVLTGCALGVDTVAAEVAASVGIPYTACVPFEGQESRWPKRAQERYHDLLAGADDIIVVSPGGFAAWKMHRRNEFMVDNSSILLATWTGTDKGGTAGCVKYGLKKHGSILRLDPFTLQYGWHSNEGWEKVGKAI